MPYVEGESLRDLLNREKQLSQEDAIRITTEVASALGYAHVHGIVHRDIKPENIMLSGGTAVVADFGIARAAAGAESAKSLTKTGTVIGTPAYMSPEQSAGVAEIDGRSDQYSLACGVYEMLVGGPPRSGPPGAGGLDPKHIAVLYFEDLSPKKDLAYLADGLTEALIADLKRVSGLDVISKNGVAPYRDPDVAPDSIARVLNVGTLVRGSVEATGDRYRVSVRLIDRASGADYRRGSFEKPRGSLLELRDSLAADVAEFLRQRIGEEVQLRHGEAGTASPEAWALVQQAQAALKTASPANPAAAEVYARADSLLAAAEGADGRWVEPIALRGRVALLRSRLEKDLRQKDGWLRAGLAHADRALALDVQRPDALEIRGTLRFERFSRGVEPDPAAADRLVESARADLEAATRLNPGQV